jgi:hypothetical protein
MILKAKKSMQKGLKVNLLDTFPEAVRFYQAENFVGAGNVCRKILQLP